MMQMFENLNNFEALTEHLRIHSPYYPKIYQEKMYEKKKRQTTFYCSTILRKEHEGVWYARHHVSSWNVVDEHIEEVDDSLGFARARQIVLHGVYLDMLFGVVDPTRKRPNGLPLDPRDVMQISERDRLIKIRS